MKTNREETDPRHVVCIEDAFTRKPCPIKGEIYEVERFEVIGGKECYYLSEFTHIKGPGRVAYLCKRFRPVDHDSGNAIAEWVEKALLSDLELETAMGV